MKFTRKHSYREAHAILERYADDYDDRAAFSMALSIRIRIAFMRANLSLSARKTIVKTGEADGKPPPAFDGAFMNLFFSRPLRQQFNRKNAARAVSVAVRGSGWLRRASERN